MPRQAQTFVENSFVKGLITEATGLNFPEQAVTETLNCVFDEKGIVRRRLGIDFEDGHSVRSGTRTDKAVTSFRWDAAAGSGDNSLVVVQIGKDLEFYLCDAGPVSDDLVDTLDLTTYASGALADLEATECQFAAGKGYLFVANPNMESIFVTYDPDTQEVAATEIAITIRDFEGVDDGLELTERPAALTDEHEYNLMNQGWNTHILDQAGGDPPGYPLTLWETDRADYPANVDTVWMLLTATDGIDTSNEPRLDRMTTPAPKGHYVLNYYDQDRNSQTTIEGRTWTGLTGRSSGDFRASTIEFFAGRVWYAGTQGTGYSNEILFSQIIERDAQVGQCYQLNDPTAQDNFDLLPSDGGVILIPDSGTVLKLFAFEDSIIIFTTNGAWRVSGSEGVGFRANDYSVTKMSSIPCLTASSFVSIAGIPAFWNAESIYTLSKDELGQTAVVSATDNTIKTFFDTIPYESKKYVRGAYNRRTRVVTWVFRTTAPTTIVERYTYDGVLHLNTVSSAFYNWTVDSSPVSINGVVVAFSEYNNAIEPSATVTSDVTKYLCSYVDTVHKLTFADEWQEFRDWLTYDDVGVEYESYFVTGYKIHGEGMRKVQPTYINLFFKTETLDSTLDFQSRWQYSKASNGRWSTTQRVTTSNNDYSYTRRRLKSRGSGIVYQFKVSSVDDEPFFIIGWSVFETANAAV